MQQHEELASQSATVQQEVTQNTCSTAQEPPISSPGAVHPQHVAELKKALDTIHQLRLRVLMLTGEIKLRDKTLEQLREEVDVAKHDLDKKLCDLAPGNLILALQTYMSEGIGLDIHEEFVCMTDSEGIEYGIKPDEFYQTLDAMRFLSERKMA